MTNNVLMNFFKIKKIEKNTKERVIKNLLALYFAFLLMFAASNGMTSIQSILNSDGSLGVISQIVIFCIQIPLSIVFPAIFIEIIGFKKTMVIIEIGYAIFVASNAYPRYYTILPGK